MKTVSMTIAALTAGLMLSAAPAYAEIIALSADLSGAQEVPPTEGDGAGTLEGTFDTDTLELSFSTSYDGLTGDAQAAHFHGPAPEGENAGVAVPIDGDLASPIAGTATLTEEQAAQLLDGLMYFNVHTEAYPDGEIRGQVIVGEAVVEGDAMAPADDAMAPADDAMAPADDAMTPEGGESIAEDGDDMNDTGDDEQDQNATQ